MKFYWATATRKNELKNGEQELTTAQRQVLARKTANFLDDEALMQNGETLARIFLVCADNELDIAVGVKDNRVDEMKLVKTFLERLHIDCVDLAIKETSMISFFNGVRAAYRGRLIMDDDEMVAGLQLENFFHGHHSFFNEKIADDNKSEEDWVADVDKYHLSNAYKEELHRVLSGKKRDLFVGNPASYFIISRDALARKIMIRNLVSALYSKGRLQGKRYTIIDVGDSECNVDTLEELYEINQGATVYLKLNRYNFPDGEQKHNCMDIKQVCEIAKKKGAKTLTVFVMDEPSDKNRNKLENYMLGFPVVAFLDNLYKQKQAKEVLQSLAQAEGFTVDEETLKKMEKSERSYTYGDIVNFYNTWRAEYMGNEVFPEYKKYVTHITDEERKEKNGNAYQKLQEMIGLTQAKKVIDGALNYFKLQQEYRNRGIEFNRPTMHMCFTGTPGTAKTTVARLVAEILKDNGILSEGRLIEVGRSQLVGEYVGTTAPKVREVFKRARGSVLFIDEAYSLMDDKKGLYGTEAINTIVQEMENRKEDVVVILAGYPEEMENLLQWNPGMKSRIAFHVPFDDYTETELFDITQLMAKERGMRIDDGAKEKLLAIYADARMDKAFGNGRFARNLLEQAKFNQANRFMAKDLRFVSDEELCTLIAEDFNCEKKVEVTRRLGFGA